MAPPDYHPYQMPMVQNSYTKAVEESDMPKPQLMGSWSAATSGWRSFNNGWGV